MKCPACTTEMEEIELQSIEIDRCPECSGIVLDRGEPEAIASLGLASVIESSVTSTTSRRDTAARCYDCKRDMISLTGAGDVEYDWCDSCERVFFDRGELSAFDAFVDS